MGLLVEVSGKRVSFDGFKFEPENGVFRSSSENLVGSPLDVKTRLTVADAIDVDKYFVFFFIKKDLAESEIFQVEDGKSGKRIGWCFPVHSIDSGEHQYADSVHYRRYAFAASTKILNDLPADVFINFPSVKEGFSIDVSDVMHDSTAALVVSKTALGRDFEVDRWLPSMASKGYFPLTSSNPDLLQVSQPRVNLVRVKLSEVSPAVVQLERLRLVYGQAFPYEPNAVFRFFYLYQIVEHLMEIIFLNEQSKLVKKIIAAADDAGATKDVLEGMGRNGSERSRIKLMVGKYSNTDSELSGVLVSCNALLVGLGKKEGKTFDRTIYPTRNQIVHRLVDFPASQLDNMKNLIAEFVGFLPILLSSFAIPDVAADVEE